MQDITCDSDGKIAQFATETGVSHFIPVHSLDKKKGSYYIGVFLVGAYQEILGDMHNLFGDTNAVHVITDKDGYHIKNIIDGETVADVLSYVQYEPKAIKEGKITLEEGKEFLDTYRSGLYGYTYLE